MAVTTLDAGEQVAGTFEFAELEGATADYLDSYPDFGRPFGSYRVFDRGQTPNIQVLYAKVHELYEDFSVLDDYDFYEGLNLRGDNMDHFTRAIEFRDAYMPFHGVDPKSLPTDEAVSVVTDYQHYKHYLGRLLDGGEQALPTGPIKLNGHQYFNARIDDRDYFFVLRTDQTWGQFTGLLMNSGATQDEWLNLGGDLLDFTQKQRSLVRQDGDGYDVVNGQWINSSNWGGRTAITAANL